MFDRYFAAHPIGEVRYAPQFPEITDRAAWEGVAPADREALLTLAQTYHQQPWPMLTAGMYASFIRTGSRTDCQTPYYFRRRKLCTAALHVCLTDSDALLGDVEDGLWLLCEETTWAISAHAALSEPHPFPDDRAAIIDLFAAQTVMILSFICQLLGDRLHPDLTDRVRREVERRILRPFMDNDGEWWMGFTRKDLNNWTPWIISNILMAANVWRWGGEKLIRRACMMLDRWLDCVPEDGGCDEGAGYWNMAGGAFLDCLMVLESLCGIDLWQEEKVRRMMAYPALVYLGGGWFANFADCDARPTISGERLQYAGLRTGNPDLIRIGADLWDKPQKEINDTPHLSRLLMRLFARPAAVADDEETPKDVWLPDLQVRLVEGRTRAWDSARGSRTVRTVAAMKGGHNHESHNHNDVGSFLIAVDGQMQAVDAGNMIYTAQTFSDRRYELWNCRAMYHNVPIIGGCEQQAGAQYAAKDVECLPNGLQLDIAGAYPAEAGALRCLRKMTLGRDSYIFHVEDEIELEVPRPVTWVFMLRDEPIIEQADKCCHGRETNYFVEWRDTEALTADVERIEITDGRMQGSYPGCLWRLTLTAQPARMHSVHITLRD